jgi:hypothetical protein
MNFLFQQSIEWSYRMPPAMQGIAIQLFEWKKVDVQNRTQNIHTQHKVVVSTDETICFAPRLVLVRRRCSRCCALHSVQHARLDAFHRVHIIG